MKLIVQIPCFNEEVTLPDVLADIPRSIAGIDKVETLIIDDGSSDRTVEVARELGVDHIVRHTHNQGLARAFMTGIKACLDRGADIVVNTDGDNQYRGKFIPKLIQPILEKKAAIVVGARPIEAIPHFSPLKKILQRLGSSVVRIVSGTDVPDAPSGFRAFSREALLQLNVFSEYTYTIETLIQAGKKNLPVSWISIDVNSKTRESRLMKNFWSYIKRSIGTMIRIFAVYRPFKFFVTLGSAVFLLGVLIGIRFLYYYFTGDGSGKVQSLILAGVLLGMGFQTIITGFLADLIGVNRKLLEDMQYRMRKIENENRGSQDTGDSKNRFHEYE